MAAFGYFVPFKQALAEGSHNFASNTLKVYLASGTPSSTMSYKSQLAEIATASGYTAGGNSCSLTSSTISGGNYLLKLGNPAQWVASTGATISGIRYAVLYNPSAPNSALIGYWDYGSSVDLQPTETLDVVFDSTNGVLQIQ